jgi:hypothetical protein
MTPTKPEGTLEAHAPINQSRREALKRFGRYAAAAPAAMILLQAREGHAGKGKGGGWGKGGKWGKCGKWANSDY